MIVLRKRRHGRGDANDRLRDRARDLGRDHSAERDGGQGVAEQHRHLPLRQRFDAARRFQRRRRLRAEQLRRFLFEPDEILVALAQEHGRHGGVGRRHFAHFFRVLRVNGPKFFQLCERARPFGRKRRFVERLEFGRDGGCALRGFRRELVDGVGRHAVAGPRQMAEHPDVLQHHLVVQLQQRRLPRQHARMQIGDVLAYVSKRKQRLPDQHGHAEYDDQRRGKSLSNNGLIVQHVGHASLLQRSRLAQPAAVDRSKLLIRIKYTLKYA
jgi:hypothetical protein